MHRTIEIVLTFVVIFSVAPSNYARAQDRDSSELRVITYNVQFLPGWASAANKRKQPDYRAARIGREMAAFDIVGLQECFDDKRRAIILDQLEEGWGSGIGVIVSPLPEEGFTFNGGCLIATRFPILETNTVVYKNFSSPDDYGILADGYAAKGCIHARIAPDGDTANAIDVFVTHLEARDPDERERQYPELARFIAAHSDPSRPLLLMGDLNTNGTVEKRSEPGSQHAMLMAALREATGREFIDGWVALHGDAHGGTSDQESIETGKRIDYVLLSNAIASAPPLEFTAIEIDPYQDPKVDYLSDHNAVEATLRRAQ